MKLRTEPRRLDYAMTHPKEIACDELRDMVRDHRDLLAEVERLRGLLRRYGSHDSSCPMRNATIDWYGATLVCNCGLDAGLAAAPTGGIGDGR